MQLKENQNKMAYWMAYHNNLKNKNAMLINSMALQYGGTEGLEPATPCVTGRYSNRLNYRSALCSVGNEANITDCLTRRQWFFSSFESFAAKIAQVAIFSAFHRYLCSPEAASAFLLHQIETGFMCCKLFICRKNNA